METEGVWGRSPAGRLAWTILVVGPLASCGAGVAGVVASSGSSGGGTTPALDAFTVESPKDSPCLLHLDASQAVRVGLFFDAGAGEQAMANLTGLAGSIAGNEVDLTASATTLEWAFAPQIGAAFTPNVRVVAKRGGAPIAGGELTLGLGNDAPEVLSIDQIEIDPDEGEASGTIGIELTVADSSDDVVSVKVEFDVQGDVPDAGWQLARPALADPGAPTPEFGITGAQVARAGTPLTFFWNTDADTDLHDLERNVALRFRATDGLLTGSPLESSTFRVDNNAPPIVQLDSGPLILNPDERRGIPIPFRVIDEEGDLVEVIFQWRHEGEEFPSLDRDGNGKIENAEVDEILADEVLRQEHHVCTPYPHFAKGRVVPIYENTVRLPELASSESWILASGIVGKTLELLRPSSIPAPITPTWRSNPLVSPIAALPVGDGLTALVLDVPGNGRLREIELSTGAVVREIATLGPGIPSAMAFEHREKAVLVALDDAGTWRIERVELASGAVRGLVVSDGSAPGPVRGLASVGTSTAVFTAGASLFLADYRDPQAPQLGTLLPGLATPWGVAVDPLSPERLYVSERDADRVLAIELDSHGKAPVVVRTGDMQSATLEAPEALALERPGSRMLIVASAPGGGRELLSLELGATGGNVLALIGAATPMDVTSVATGPDGLRTLCLPAANEFLVAGGVEQRHGIAAHSPSSQEVTAEPPLDPVPTAGQPWRIPEGSQRLRASAQGGVARFVWDSTDAQGGPVFLQAIGRDDEPGVAADGAAAKNVRSSLDVAPLELGSTSTTDSPGSVAAADLDGDGDRDLVSASRSGLTVFFQRAPGGFDASPLVLSGSGTTDRFVSVAAADLDGDGDQDLAAANANGSNLTVFSQLAPGSFAGTPLLLGGSGTTDSPFSIAAADLDRDGDLDLASANFGSNDLTVFFQRAPGSFDGTPLVVGGAGTTDFPITLAAADLDGDGDDDLVSAPLLGRDLTVFLQLAPGSFAKTLVALGDSGFSNFVAAADLDGDGDQDLISANGGARNLTVFSQLAPGSFGAPLALSGLTSSPASVTATDLDGDGDQDLVSANGRGNSLTAFFQRTTGSFAGNPLVLGGSGTTRNPLSVAAADLDGDGGQDLVSANSDGDDLTVFLQRAPGSFEATPLVLAAFPVMSSPRSIASADLDGNGSQDLVSANSDSMNLTAFFQLSPGSFTGAPLVLDIPVGTTPASIAAADLDGDGDQDLVSAGGTDLPIRFQESPGSFGAAVLVNNPSAFPLSVVAADLDGDGDQDLVSANASAVGNLTIFFQGSAGSFATVPLRLVGFGESEFPVSVAAADFEGDGSLDLVSANQNGNDLLVFFQGSGGDFATAPLVLGGLGLTDLPLSVAAADLDGDGDQDLVSANAFSNDLTVFFQLVRGTFAGAPLVLGGSPTTDHPQSVAAADFDRDGDQDLVSANFVGNDLTVFSQLARGSFGENPRVLGGFPTTIEPIAVLAMDLDGDGDQDIVSANFDGSNLTVFGGGR